MDALAKSLDDVVSAVPGLGGEVVAEPEAITLGPSLVPDEEMETKIELRRAIVRDPSGYSIEVIEGERTDPVGRVVLPVTDLDRAIDFYTGSMGMTMHRKRSLVPLEPAMCAYLSFADSEDASTLLELRYNYATKRISTGSVAQHLTISTPDVPAVVDSLVADAPVSARGESDATVGDPEGYGLELMDELELLKQTLG